MVDLKGRVEGRARKIEGTAIADAVTDQALPPAAGRRRRARRGHGKLPAGPLSRANETLIASRVCETEPAFGSSRAWTSIIE